MKKEALKPIWQFRAIEYVVYLCVFCIPLYINYNHWFPFGAPKALLLIGSVAVMILLYSWGRLVERDSIFSVTGLHGVMVLFLGALVLSAICGVDPHNSFFGTWTQMNSVVMLATLATFSFLIGFLIKRNKSFLVSVMSVSLAASTIVAGITYAGVKIIRLSSDGSTIGNNSYLGAYLLFNVCFGVGLFFWYRKKWQQSLVGLATSVVILSPALFNRDIWSGKISLFELLKKPTDIFGNANGAILGLGVALLAVLFLWWEQSSRKSIALLGKIFFVLLVGGLFVLGHLLVTPETAIHRFYAAQKNENRFVFWDIAGQGFQDRPFFGNGFNNYSYTYQEHFTPIIFDTTHAPELWVNQPHNIFWEYLSTTGIVGLFLYGTLLGMTVVTIYTYVSGTDRRQKILGIVLIGASIGYIVQNLFIFDTIVPLILCYTIIGIAIGVSSQKSATFKVEGIVKKVLMLVLIIGSISIFIWLTVVPWRESKRWGTLASQTSFQDLAKTRSGIQDISIFGGVQDTTYLSDRFYQSIQKSVMTINDTNKGYVLAEITSLQDTLEYDIKRQTDNFRAELVLGNLATLELYIQKTRDPLLFKEARSHFIKAQKINPKNPVSYLGIAQTYIYENDITLAKASVVDAITTVPQYAQSYVFGGELLKIAPDKEFAEYLEYMRKKHL